MTDVNTYANALMSHHGWAGGCLLTVNFDKTTRLHLRKHGIGKMVIHDISKAMAKAKKGTYAATPEGELRTLAAELLTTYGMEVVNGIGPDDKWAVEVLSLRNPEGATVKATLSGVSTEDNAWKVVAYGDAAQMEDIAKAYSELMRADYNKGKSKSKQIPIAA